MNTPVSVLLAEKRGELLSVSPDDTALEAVSRMNERRIGSVLVLEHGRLVGIFTERDVLQRIVAAGRDPQKTLVREVMTSDPVTLDASTTVQEAMDVVNQKKCRHLPVLKGSELLGLISSGDLNRHMTEFLNSEAASLMSYINGDAHSA